MFALVNGTILCPIQGKVENATVLVEDGKIKDIGTNITPEGVKIVDVSGKFIVPGFIDAHTHQGLFDGSIGWAGMDGNEMTDPVTPHVRGIDSFNPFEPSLEEVVRGGVTTINTGPGSGNVISGETLTVKVTGSNVVDKMILQAPSGLKVALGENPKRYHGQVNKRMPSTRMGVAALLRKTLTEALNYIREREAYQIKIETAEKEGKTPPSPPKKNLKMETIVKVLRKEIPLHAHAHRADDIATIIRIAEEFDVNLVLIHCTEGSKIVNYLAEKKYPAVVGPTLYWVSKPETRERGFKTAVDLVKAGVKVALQTDSLTPMHHFQLLPMYVIKAGLSPEEALQCVTINPAEILNVSDRIGSLEIGKDADIVIWSGDPFDFYSKVELVFISGEKVYSET